MNIKKYGIRISFNQEHLKCRKHVWQARISDAAQHCLMLSIILKRLSCQTAGMRKLLLLLA